MPRKITKEMIQKIREEVINGKVKYTVATEVGVPYQLVYYHTRDLPSSKPGRTEIRGITLELLKHLLTDGCVESTQGRAHTFIR